MLKLTQAGKFQECPLSGGATFLDSAKGGDTHHPPYDRRWLFKRHIELKQPPRPSEPHGGRPFGRDQINSQNPGRTGSWNRMPNAYGGDDCVIIRPRPAVRAHSALTRTISKGARQMACIFNIRLIYVAITLAGASLTACSSTKTSSMPPVPATPGPVTGIAATLTPYKVQVGDVLDIKLFQNPELNDEVTVRPDGMISTAVAEDIVAYDKTPTEISADLRNRYRSNLNNPQISVVVHSFAPNRIYVGGEVANPGEFITVGPNLTVSQAVARAGGVKLSADRSRLFVLRRGSGDVPQALSVDYMSVIEGRHPEADARLAQYDVVYVPRTGVYDAFVYWNQFVQQFVPVSWGFSYNVNPVVNNR